MVLKEDTSPVASLAESLVISILEIIELVVCIEVEQESFIEIGCYLYRASLAIMELQRTDNTPENAMEILQSLFKNIALAKTLVRKCQRGTQPISDPELTSIIAQLEGVIKHMGEGLSLIPSSTYGDQEYAEVAVRALSNEMKNAHFKVSQTQISKPEEPEQLMLSFKEQPEEESSPEEKDLYSINFEVFMENPQKLDMPNLHLNEFQSTSNRNQNNHGNRRTGTFATFPEVVRYMEPLYETFCCPLRKKVMEDPVTVETGITYERKAITEWFDKFESSEEICCPTTGQKLVSRVLSTNTALKSTIEEWRERDEAERIKVARAALSLASSESMILEALNDLQSICQRTQYNRVQVRNFGMIQLIIKFLEHEDRMVRCATLEILHQLAEEDDEGKETIANTMNISTLIKMLSSNHRPIRHASLLFMLELSKSESVCEKIGSVNGGILKLITVKYNQSSDAFSSEKADEILRNMERSPNNIRRMAENGLLEPLLNHLIEGSEEMKMEMGSCLGEIVLGDDSKTYVAKRASPALIKMVHSGSAPTRKAAFKALKQISSYQTNGKILVEAGTIQVMVDEMFTRRIYNEVMNSKKEAAAILANILESGLELETIQVNTHGHTMASDYFVFNIICMVKNSTPDELNINLIRILLCLTKTSKSTATIVSVIKETEARYTLIEFINNPHEELAIAAIKLLIMLSPYMGHTLADKLCKTKGQPQNLIQYSTQTTQITERQAVSATFLAKLPHQNLSLNLALLNKNTVPTVLQTINQLQRNETRTNRYASAYLEGLVGILVRFTATLYEPQMLFLARNHNFTLVFTELLMRTSSDEVQRLSATGLENLSSESINLSVVPKPKRTKFMKLFYLPKSLSFMSPKKRKVPVCPVHRGTCSSQNTFCLVDAKAVERLLVCLDHENAEVVEAALSAISTLLDDKVDVDKSVNMLSGVNAIQHVLKVVRDHKQEGLWQKSFWVIERFLIKGGDKSAASDISQDRLLLSTLTSVFHHGNENSRQMAERILTHLNLLPNFSTTSNTL